MKYADVIKKNADGTIDEMKSSRKVEQKKRQFTTHVNKLKDQRDVTQDQLDDLLINPEMSPEEINKLDVELATTSKKLELAEKRMKELF